MGMDAGDLRVLGERLRALGPLVKNRSARRAVAAGIEILKEAIDDNIEAGRGSDSLKTSLKAANGSRLVQSSADEVTGKAGLGVGKGAGAVGKRSGKKGVGIGARNAHWFATGTNQRWQGLKSKRGKLSRGRFQLTGNTIRFVGSLGAGHYAQVGNLAVGRSWKATAAAFDADLANLLQEFDK